MQIAIKMVNDSTEVNFYWDECLELSIQDIREKDVFQFGGDYYEFVNPAKPGTYGMYYTSNRYKKIDFTLATMTSDSLGKIQTMRAWVDEYNQPKPFKFYYEYIISTTNYLWVQFIRESYVEIYTQGKQAFMDNTRFQFIETIPSGVGIIDKPDDLIGGI